VRTCDLLLKSRHPQLPDKKPLVRLVEDAIGALQSALLRSRAARAKRSVAIASSGASAPLRALTLAAMALPGMAYAAETEDAQIQYGHYSEGGRNYWPGPKGTVQQPDPLRVDSLQLGLGVRLTDRNKLALHFAQDTWSGATPILSAPEAFLTVSGASAYPASDSRVNRALVPYGVGPTGTRVPQPTVWNVMTAASAETRRQADATFTHEWDNAALSIGGGFSNEPDFRSYFGQASGRWDFNRKLTSVNAGASYTSSNVDANLGAPVDWIDYGKYANALSGPSVVGSVQNGGVVQHFVGTRSEWAANLGLTQVLGRNTTASLGFAYAHSAGFLENPYKLVLLAFADPNTPPFLFNGLLQTRLFSVAESRPDTRNQWTVSTKLSHYLDFVDAAVHAKLDYAQDDWGIRAGTAELDWSQGFGRGWLLTPRVRYYTQSSADFYQPYFIWAQRAPVNASGKLNFDRVPAQYYSSDYRLAGYGAVSAGMSLTKRFARGIDVQAGFEYYEQSGRFKYGGGGVDTFADFHSWLFNVGLALDLTQSSPVPDEMREYHADVQPDEHAGHGQHDDHASHAGMLAPAGVMSAHMMDKPGDLMVGYRFMVSHQSGRMLHGSDPAGDDAIAAYGCGAIQCTFAPSTMAMHMHMLDLMYAVSSNINVMAMLQLSDMEMTMRPLPGTIGGGGGAHDHSAHPSHNTGGVGDTSVSALLKLFSTSTHEVHAGLGISIPTGAVNEKMSNGDFMDYGMQLGSGTWDLLPSLTYTGLYRRLFWGAQASGTYRLQSNNQSGYALGDVVQSTAWGGLQLAQWLAGTVRAIYTRQGAIRGQYNGPQTIVSPADVPANYGGRYWDVGIGLSAALPGRAGNRIGFEWLQPVRDDVNGYQLERNGTAWLNLNFVF